MTIRNSTIRVLSLIAGGFAGIASSVQAAVIDVPADYTTIQAAINASVDGDTVLVAPGDYNEAIDFAGRSISVVSSGGLGVTSINAMGLNATVVTADGGEGSATRLEGFTITGGSPQGAFAGGGGIYVGIDSELTVRNCTITANHTPYAGGGMYVFGGHAVVEDCMFINNTTDFLGAGVYASSGDLTVRDTQFANSSVPFPSADSAGVEHSGGGRLTVAGCRFVNNDGIGVVTFSGESLITNCLFANNSAAGFSSRIGATGASLVNCTFVGNQNPSPSYPGGAMTIHQSEVEATNCILWDNGPDEIYVDFYDGQLTMSYSLVQGGYPGEGNIDADPLFVDAPAGDYQLASGSPAIDAGTNEVIAACASDLDGLSRRAEDPAAPDTGLGVPGAPLVDLGCHERNSAPSDCIVAENLTQGTAHDSISEAITVAVNDDTIVAARGNHFEAIHFGAKSITLRGMDPGDDIVSADTVINAVGLDQRAVTIDGGAGLDVLLEGLTITGGSPQGAFAGGGGIYVGVGSELTLRNCIVTGNHTPYAGGGLYLFGGDGLVEKCIFTNNTTDFLGAGAYATNGDLTVRDSLFANSSVPFPSADSAGVEHSGGGNLTVTGCRFLDNDGIGVVTFSGDSFIANCLFANNNAAGFSSRIGATGASLVNCTFVGNQNPSPSYPGGAMTIHQSEVEATNCVLWDNGPDEIYVDFSDGQLTMSYSLVQGGYPGEGNIDADPLFIDAAAGEHQLASGSPAIDAGNNFALPVEISTDLAGEARYFDDPGTPDTGLGTPPVIDMGAYEFSPSLVADLDGDGEVGLPDLLIVLNSWGPCPAPPAECPADIMPLPDGDGVVGLADLLMVLSSWGLTI